MLNCKSKFIEFERQTHPLSSMCSSSGESITITSFSFWSSIGLTTLFKTICSLLTRRALFAFLAFTLSFDRFLGTSSIFQSSGVGARCSWSQGIVSLRRLHGGPSEAGDCSHPPPKMATAENPTPGEAAFYRVAGHGSLWFLACKHVSGRANLWYRNVRSSHVRIAQRSTRIFRREAGDLVKRGGWLTVGRRVTQHSSGAFGVSDMFV